MRKAIIEINKFNRGGVSDSDENNIITIDSSLAGQTLSLTRMLPLFLNNRSGSKNVMITGPVNNGNPDFTLDGGGSYRGFFTTPRVLGGSSNGNLTITIKNIILQNNHDIGGAGNGGAAGLGGGLFVGENTHVILENVSFLNCKAQGGNGDVADGGGGLSGGNAGSSGGGIGGGSSGSAGGGGLGNIATIAHTGGYFAEELGGDDLGGGSLSGQGGFGGGGGSAGSFAQSGGNGGFGGGGGANDLSGSIGGNGGFGGGGGLSGSAGGNGGFGGGGGRRVSRGIAPAGFGGGAGGGRGGITGNGGCGFGGAIFVQNDGSLTIKSVNFDNSSVGFGSAGSNAVADGSDIYLHGNANLTFDLAEDLTLTNPIGGNKRSVDSTGNFVKDGVGKLTLAPGEWPFKGSCIINNGALAFSTSNSLGTGTITLAGGTLSPTASLTLSKVITLNPGESRIEVSGGGDNVIFSGTILGVGSFEKTGTGTLILSGSKIYSGATGIGAGELRINTANALPSGTSVTVSGTLNLNNLNQTIASLAGTGTVNLGSGTLTTGDNGDTTFSGSVNETGGITKVGAGIFTLSGSNSYSGATLISAGTLRGGSTNSFSPNSSVTVTGTLALNNTNQEISSLIGAGIIQLGSGTLTTGGNDASTTYSGTTDGAGGLTKTGTGVFTISGSGNHTYSGATLVSAGTLKAGSQNALSPNSEMTVTGTLDLNNLDNVVGSLSGSGALMLGSGTLTTGGKNTSTAFSGTSSGSGGLTKAGTGTFTLSGSNAYTGVTAINSGALAVNGSITSDVSVNNSGTLQGTGTVTGMVTVADGATLKPGNSIGQINIVGDLMLDSNSTTDIEISTATSSLINVNGTATLNGTLSITAQTGKYSDEFQYTVLTANDIMGTFSRLTVPSLFDGTMAFSIVANSVILNFIPNRSINVSVLSGGNAKAVANYLNRFTTSPDLKPILTDLRYLSPDQLEAAMASISPGRNACSGFVANTLVFMANKQISSRMSDTRTPGGNRLAFASAIQDMAQLKGLLAQAESNTSATSFLWKTGKNKRAFKKDSSKTDQSPAYGEAQTILQNDSAYAFWMEGLGAWIHQDAQDLVPSFDSSTGGGVIGFDYYAQNGMLTTAFNYARTGMTQGGNAGSGTIDTYAVAMFGACYHQNGYLNFGMSGVYNSYSNARNVQFPGFNQTATSSFSSWQFVPHLEGGYDYLFSWGILEPFIGFDCAFSFQESYREHGAGVLNMRQSSSDSIFLRSQIGLNAYEIWKMSWGYFILKERLCYVNREPWRVGTVDAALVGFPSGFSVVSFTKNESLGSVSLDLFFKWNNGIFFSTQYGGEYGSGVLFNQVLGKIGAFF